MDVQPNPDDLIPADRLREVAAILARGMLRLRKPRRCGAFSSGSPDSCEKTPESGPQGLELSDETRLSVRAG
jgi:hypothetical protein